MSLDRGLNANRQSKPWKARTRERERERNNNKERTNERKTDRQTQSKNAGISLFYQYQMYFESVKLLNKVNSKEQTQAKAETIKGYVPRSGVPLNQ